jgi:putative membrane-bound dehydrogenase-like protein
MCMRCALAVAAFFLILSQVSAQSNLPDAPVPPREAPLRMTVPDGFKVTLFAGEPDVVQPIAFTFDDRGRLWVVECMSYPKWNKEPQPAQRASGLTPEVPAPHLRDQPGGSPIDRRKGKDRVVIFEDTDGDGQFDKRTVFADGLTNLSGIEYGFGGIWLCSIPNLIYIPIAGKGDRTSKNTGPVPFSGEPGQEKPAGPPEIKLDGWSLDSGHNAFNSLKWGPDGWLYGCNGILATSRVGVPGTPAKDRVPINCGVWRYHPTKKKFEVVAHGTTNPWGLDWDEYGEMFITNCVIDHVWHVVPGGHYERMYGQDFNPNLYKLMPSIADHKHWAGGSWTESRGGKGAHSDAGGGHAHVGCMIYLGDNWPKQYRGGLFTCNLHGNRINHDLLERKGSSYVAHHGKDFLFANDPWFRGIAIDYGPDGGVYVSDWCDTGECHNYQVAHTTTGRIYKVTYGQPKAWRGDLAKVSDDGLLALQSHKNEWFVRHARRLIHERAATQKLTKKREDLLRAVLNPFGSDREQLRALWVYHVAGMQDPLAFAVMQDTQHTAESTRAWAIRLALDDAPAVLPKTIFADDPETIIEVSARDNSRLVRLQVAAGLQRLPSIKRWPIAEELLQDSGVAQDPYMSLLIWYGIEPVIAMSIRDEWLAKLKIPMLREFAAKRLTGVPEGMNSVLEQLTSGPANDSHFLQRDALRGIFAALQGRRSVDMPERWKEAYPHLVQSPLSEIRDKAMALAVLFGDERALTSLRKIAADGKASLGQRQAALQTLAFKQPPTLPALLYDLLDDPGIRSSAIQGLAAYADPKTPSLILQRYAKFTHDEKSDAVHTLASRPSYALALLDAVADKTVARTDLNAFTVRQLLALNDKRVTARVNEVWGTLRPASQEKAALMAKYKKLLTADTLKQANLQSGRLVYTKNCAACHKLFGEGGAIGPELTGSQRANLDYVLENMLDPSAVVPREYQVSIITTENGRTLTGIIKEETERALTVQTQNEVVIIPKSEIESRRQSNLSMMPEGILDRLTIEEIRDLVAYLASPAQARLPMR